MLQCIKITQVDNGSNRVSRYWSKLWLEGLVLVQGIGCLYDQGAQHKKS
jgi:hypothetical protein